MAKTTETTEKTKNPNEEVVELDTPIIRGEQKITEVTLRKPTRENR